jgi:hypothetical protein
MRFESLAGRKTYAAPFEGFKRTFTSRIPDEKKGRLSATLFTNEWDEQELSP